MSFLRIVKMKIAVRQNKMYRIAIKPLSANQVWRGRRFKTKKYTDYEKELFLLLPKLKIPEGKLKLFIQVGFSSKASDLDNIIKPFQDILQKAYNFNDKKIYKLEVEKIDVKKGEDFINFTLLEIK